MMTDFAYDSLPVIIKLINFLPYTENLFFYDTRFFFSALSLCYHSFSRCYWFVAPSHGLMRTSDLITKVHQMFLELEDFS